MDKSTYASSYEVVTGMSNRIWAALRENDAGTDWQAMRSALQSEYALDIESLYNRTICQADGSDLIGRALERAAEETNLVESTVEGMANSMLEWADGSSRIGVHWNVSREQLQNDNAFAIDILAEMGECNPDGSDLVEEARSRISDRVAIERREVMPGNFMELLVLRNSLDNRTAESKPEPPEPIEKAEPYETAPIGWWRKLRRLLTFPRLLNAVSLTRAAVALVLVVLALLGITLADVVPLPCDLWPFSIAERCNS